MAYQTLKVTVNYSDCSRWFKSQRVANPYFARLNFSSAQTTMRRLDKAFSRFFSRVKAKQGRAGYPRFKGKDKFNSITFPRHGDGIRLIGNRLRVQHVGTIRVKLHRPVQGVIKTVTVRREAGKWYVIVDCEIPDTSIGQSALPPAGIDVGLTAFLTTSTGTIEPNPRYLKNALPRLRVATRSVSRKKRKGKNRSKAGRKLQGIHIRVKNSRREHHFQVANRLVLAFGMIAVESLNIKKMLKNNRLSRAISDAGWSSFLSILKHKAESAGVQFVEVDPAGTTQQCSRCHREVPKDLSVRWHDCPHCGLSLSRDHNAALNILERGLARTGPAGANVGQ